MVCSLEMVRLYNLSKYVKEEFSVVKFMGKSIIKNKAFDW